MAVFKNVSPFGAIDVDAIGRQGIEPGEEFEVPDEIAIAFIGQGEIFEPVDVTGVAVPGDESAEDQAGDEPAETAEQDGDASAPTENQPVGDAPAETKKGGRRGNAA